MATAFVLHSIRALITRERALEVSVDGISEPAYHFAPPWGLTAQVRSQIARMEDLIREILEARSRPFGRYRALTERYQALMELEREIGECLALLLFEVDGKQTPLPAGNSFFKRINALLDEVVCQPGAYLRLLLGVDDVELERLPWELLRVPGSSTPLALDPRLSLSRLFRGNVQTHPPERRAVSPAHSGESCLRVLALTSDPSQSRSEERFCGPGGDYAGQSEECLRFGLQPLTDEGLADIEVCAFEKLSDVQQRRPRVDVLHFLGHGGQSEAAQANDAVRPFVLFVPHLTRQEKIGLDARTFHRLVCPQVPDERSGAALGPQRLRLAVLGGCYSSGNLAQGPAAARDETACAVFLEEGADAVVGIQGQVYVPGLVMLSLALYGALGRGEPLDRAMHHVRSRLHSFGLHEWAAWDWPPCHWYRPVLWVRSEEALEPLRSEALSGAAESTWSLRLGSSTLAAPVKLAGEADPPSRRPRHADSPSSRSDGPRAPLARVPLPQKSSQDATISDVSSTENASIPVTLFHGGERIARTTVPRQLFEREVAELQTVPRSLQGNCTNDWTGSRLSSMLVSSRMARCLRGALRSAQAGGKRIDLVMEVPQTGADLPLEALGLPLVGAAYLPREEELDPDEVAQRRLIRDLSALAGAPASHDSLGLVPQVTLSRRVPEAPVKRSRASRRRGPLRVLLVSASGGTDAFDTLRRVLDELKAAYLSATSGECAGADDPGIEWDILASSSPEGLARWFDLSPPDSAIGLHLVLEHEPPADATSIAVWLRSWAVQLERASLVTVSGRNASPGLLHALSASGLSRLIGNAADHRSLGTLWTLLSQGLPAWEALGRLRLGMATRADPAVPWTSLVAIGRSWEDRMVDRVSDVEMLGQERLARVPVAGRSEWELELADLEALLFRQGERSDLAAGDVVMPRVAVLYGPPGCGKRTAVAALSARSVRRRMIAISAQAPFSLHSVRSRLIGRLALAWPELVAALREATSLEEIFALIASPRPSQRVDLATLPEILLILEDVDRLLEPGTGDRSWKPTPEFPLDALSLLLAPGASTSVLLLSRVPLCGLVPELDRSLHVAMPPLGRAAFSRVLDTLPQCRSLDPQRVWDCLGGIPGALRTLEMRLSGGADGGRPLDAALHQTSREWTFEFEGAIGRLDPVDRDCLTRVSVWRDAVTEAAWKQVAGMLPSGFVPRVCSLGLAVPEREQDATPRRVVPRPLAGYLADRPDARELVCQAHQAAALALLPEPPSLVEALGLIAQERDRTRVVVALEARHHWLSAARLEEAERKEALLCRAGRIEWSIWPVLTPEQKERLPQEVLEAGASGIAKVEAMLRRISSALDARMPTEECRLRSGSAIEAARSLAAPDLLLAARLLQLEVISLRGWKALTSTGGPAEQSLEVEALAQEVETLAAEVAIRHPNLATLARIEREYLCARSGLKPVRPCVEAIDGLLPDTGSFSFSIWSRGQERALMLSGRGDAADALNRLDRLLERSREADARSISRWLCYRALYQTEVHGDERASREDLAKVRALLGAESDPLGVLAQLASLERVYEAIGAPADALQCSLSVLLLIRRLPGNELLEHPEHSVWYRVAIRALLMRDSKPEALELATRALLQVARRIDGEDVTRTDRLTAYLWLVSAGAAYCQGQVQEWARRFLEAGGEQEQPLGAIEVLSNLAHVQMQESNYDGADQSLDHAQRIALEVLPSPDKRADDARILPGLLQQPGVSIAVTRVDLITKRVRNLLYLVRLSAANGEERLERLRKASELLEGLPAWIAGIDEHQDRALRMAAYYSDLGSLRGERAEWVESVRCHALALEWHERCGASAASVNDELNLRLAELELHLADRDRAASLASLSAAMEAGHRTSLGEALLTKLEADTLARIQRLEAPAEGAESLTPAMNRPPDT